VSAPSWPYYLSVLACVVVVWMSIGAVATFIAALGHVWGAKSWSRAAATRSVTYRGRHRGGLVTERRRRGRAWSGSRSAPQRGQGGQRGLNLGR